MKTKLSSKHQRKVMRQVDLRHVSSEKLARWQVTGLQVVQAPQNEVKTVIRV